MELSGADVFRVLAKNGLENLYHANTVITSSHFLSAGGLLSRGTVERRGVYQTPQQSDQIDQAFSIWFDVFTDSVDIHHRARRVNAYGPVMFVIDAAILKDYPSVSVTKSNPTNWKTGDSLDQRWFQSSSEFRKGFIKGEFDQMIVFRNCGGQLPFSNYLREIILDDPKKSSIGKMDYYSMAYGALALAKTLGNVDVKIKRRQCRQGCKCLTTSKRKDLATAFVAKRVKE